MGLHCMVSFHFLITFVHDTHFSCHIDLQLCTEHFGITAWLCGEFENDWVTENKLLTKKISRRFDFKIYFGCIFYSILQHSVCVCVCVCVCGGGGGVWNRIRFRKIMLIMAKGMHDFLPCCLGLVRVWMCNYSSYKILMQLIMQVLISINIRRDGNAKLGR